MLRRGHSLHRLSCETAFVVLLAAAVAVCLPRHAANLRVQSGHFVLGSCHILVLSNHLRMHRLRNAAVSFTPGTGGGRISSTCCDIASAANFAQVV